MTATKNMRPVPGCHHTPPHFTWEGCARKRKKECYARRDMPCNFVPVPERIGGVCEFCGKVGGG